MSLSVGIVGLPNVGKSTLFNALLSRQMAYVANFPFATIEPNVGIVPVPDARLAKLAQVVKESENLDKLPPEVPATVEFLDIAGLIAGAHKGEGLGNKFLAHIREVSAVCHVVRAFTDDNIVREGSSDPVSDLEVIEIELLMADLATLEKQKRGESDIEKLKKAISGGTPARDVDLTEDETRSAKELSLLTMKPILVVLNADEMSFKETGKFEKEYSDKFSLKLDQVIAICAKTEEELAALSKDDQKEYLREIGLKNSGLERLVQKATLTLGLIHFLTAGEKPASTRGASSTRGGEVRAWTIKKGISAKEAAGVIHSDFEKKFIKADVVSFDDFVKAGGPASTLRGGWKGARDLGKVRSEGKDYAVGDGDVIEFKVGS